MIKSRFTFAEATTNVGKCLQLDSLYSEYLVYLNTCTETLIQNKQSSLAPSALRTFFPTPQTLSSQITKNIQRQAVDIISTWTRALYGEACFKSAIRRGSQEPSVLQGTSAQCLKSWSWWWFCWATSGVVCNNRACTVRPGAYCESTWGIQWFA